MINMSGHSKIVHRSLLTRDLMAGIPQNGLLLLIVLGIIFTYGLEMYFMLVPIAALYGIMRFLTKKDPWFVDIVLENIMQKDRFIP